MFKKLIVLVMMLAAAPIFAQEYNSSLTGAQIDAGATAGNNAAAVNGIIKSNGAGSFSAASAGTDYQAPLTAGTDYLRPGTDVDDTPVNGETNQPISSNWAYDHAAAADPHTGYMLESNIGTGASNYLQLSASPGTPDGTKFLRDDGTWQLPSAGYTNLTSFISQTPWRLFYSNTDGDVVELALGSDGTYLRSNGASSAPTWDTPSGAAHDAVTLSTDLANNLLGLSTQQLTLDNQTANYVFAGPTSGGAAVPSFRALGATDIPDLSGTYATASHNHSGTYQPDDSDLDSLAAGITGLVKGAGNGGGYSAASAGTDYQAPLTAGTDYLRPGTDVDDTPVNGETNQPISSNWAYDHAAAAASESATGHVELATTAETQTGTDTSRAVTPAGVKAVADTKAPVTISRTEFIPVAWMIDGAAAPDAIATVDLGTRQVKARTFASDSSEDLEFFWQAPIDIIDGDSGTAGFQVKWRPIYVITASTAPASGEGVTFALSACSSGDSDSGNCTVGDDSVVAYEDLNGHVQYDLVYGTYSAMTVTDGAAAEAWMMKVYRDHDHASDDYGQVVGLIGIEIKYKATLADSY